MFVTLRSVVHLSEKCALFLIRYMYIVVNE
jgi:hypothetical protein